LISLSLGLAALLPLKFSPTIGPALLMPAAAVTTTATVRSRRRVRGGRVLGAIYRFLKPTLVDFDAFARSEGCRSINNVVFAGARDTPLFVDSSCLRDVRRGDDLLLEK